MFWFTPITRSPAQKPAHKDLGRNGQSPAITPKAAYAPVSNRAGSRSLTFSPVKRFSTLTVNSIKHASENWTRNDPD
ncbi:Alpha-galactosidase [Lacticaseibacillus rhamnosus LOCK900]|nr:Alpha-galactosidase [Lacticaseibacillus rhamnosus LOCK900]